MLTTIAAFPWVGTYMRSDRTPVRYPGAVFQSDGRREAEACKEAVMADHATAVVSVEEPEPGRFVGVVREHTSTLPIFAAINRSIREFRDRPAT
jgi:hypothetical protein